MSVTDRIRGALTPMIKLEDKVNRQAEAMKAQQQARPHVDQVRLSPYDPRMKIVNVHEAKTHLSRLLEEVEAGQEVVIARAGRPVARLTALLPARAPRRLGALAGLYTVPEDWDAPLPADVIARFGGVA
jgi:prevent-host-death family protein